MGDTQGFENISTDGAAVGEKRITANTPAQQASRGTRSALGAHPGTPALAASLSFLAPRPGTRGMSIPGRPAWPGADVSLCALHGAQEDPTLQVAGRGPCGWSGSGSNFPFLFSLAKGSGECDRGTPHSQVNRADDWLPAALKSAQVNTHLPNPRCIFLFTWEISLSASLSARHPSTCCGCGLGQRCPFGSSEKPALELETQGMCRGGCEREGRGSSPRSRRGQGGSGEAVTSLLGTPDPGQPGRSFLQVPRLGLAGASCGSLSLEGRLE